MITTYHFLASILANNPLCSKTMFYCGIILAISAFIAFIIVKNERPRRKLARAIDAIADQDFSKADELLMTASNDGYPENLLCLAYVSARLGKKDDCLAALLKLEDYSSAELSHLRDYLEDESSDVQELDEYIHQADYYYQQAEAATTVKEEDDEDAYVDERNQKLDYAILCALCECMIALLAPLKAAPLKKSSLAHDPDFLWLHAIRQSRLGMEE